MRFCSSHFRCCAVTLLWLPMLLAGGNQATAQARPARQALPVSVLLSTVAPLPITAATSKYARQSEVRWSDADLRARPFGVRHRVDFFPDTSFELVFDTRLHTSAQAVSYAGYAVNHPGSMAVLTQFKGLIKLTVDSPTRGHYSVHPQPNGRYNAREYTGEGAKHEPDDFDDPESHLAYTNKVLAKYDTGAIGPSGALCREPNTSPELALLLQEKVQIEAEIAALDGSPPVPINAPECIETAATRCDTSPPAPTEPAPRPSGVSISIGGFGFGGFGGGRGGGAGRPSDAATAGHGQGQGRPSGRGGVGVGVGFDIGAGIQMVVAAAQLAGKQRELKSIDEKIVLISRAMPVSAACTGQVRAARANHERIQRWLQREISKRAAPAAPASRRLIGAYDVSPSTPAWQVKMGDALAALSDQSFAQVTTDATAPSPAGQSIRRVALPAIDVDSVAIDSACGDSSGSIRLAVVVSQQVMAKAGRNAAEVAILGVEIIHGLDITNAALHGSNISTPGIDVGFSLANVQSEALVMNIRHDTNSDDAVNSVFGAYWPPDETEEARTFYTDVEKVAPNADVVLLLIDGDASLAAPRGVAFGTKNIKGDSSTNRRLAVVKHSASVAEYFYTFAHELGHALGAGHDLASQGYQSFARGAVVRTGDKRWASLMALSQCDDDAPGAELKHSCRRVPYYSSAGLSYPGYSDTLLGDADKDNASAMRLIRDNVTRLRCSQPRDVAVWMQKGEAPDLAGKAQPWEAASVWIRPALDLNWRYPYSHLPAGAGADAFVNVMLHNAATTATNSALQLWRAKPAQGLLLSPRWEDMERVDQTQCVTPVNGNVTLAQAATSIVQIPCVSGPATASVFGRDSWVVRWGEGANAASDFVNDTVAQQPLTAWRSMREVKLDLQQPSMQVLLVRNRSNSEPRQVNVRIEPAANQYNFSVRDTGLTEVRYARNLCRNQNKPECAVVVGRTGAVAPFEGATMTLELTVPPGEEAPVRLFFERTPNVPQQNVLLRVFEEELKLVSSSGTQGTTVVGGTSFIVKHAPGDVKKAK